MGEEEGDEWPVGKFVSVPKGQHNNQQEEARGEGEKRGGGREALNKDSLVPWRNYGRGKLLRHLAMSHVTLFYTFF